VRPDATVYEAVSRMVRRNIGALVVTDDRGELRGIITERDYLRKVVVLGRTSPTTLVDQIMTGDVVTVSPRSTLNDCLVLMTRQRCRHLPVVDAGVVCGVVSIGDCAREIADHSEVVIQYYTDFIAGRYPA